MQRVMTTENVSKKSKGEVLLVLRMYSDRVLLHALTQKGDLLFTRETRLVSALDYGDNVDAIANVAERAASSLRNAGCEVSVVMIYDGARRLSVAVERQFDLCLRCEDLVVTALCELYGEGAVLFISPKDKMAFMSLDGRAATYSRGLPDDLLGMIDMQIRYFRPDRLVIVEEDEDKAVMRICAEHGIELVLLTGRARAELSKTVLRILCSKSIALKRAKNT